jgi:hypothetical protein
MPPVRPVRATFIAHGSRQRDITRKVQVASSTVHAPWTALRVRWVPVDCFSTLSLRPFAVYVACLRSDSYGLCDLPMWPWSFVGLSLTYVPPSLSSPMGSPVFCMKDSNTRTEVACFCVPRPLSAAPQHLHKVNQVDLCHRYLARGPCFGPYFPSPCMVSGFAG